MKDLYEIIKLNVSEKGYEPKNNSTRFDEFVNYLKMDIPLGCSRIGGPVVDLPDDIKYPDDLYFLAQLNCSEIKPFDKIGLLPENGFLYFFLEESLDNGLVYYANKDVSLLKRITKEHEECNWYGKIINGYKTEIEKIESRYAEEDGRKIWDSFAGYEISKIYGIYSNCNAEEKDVFKFMKNDDKIILLQIGNDYMDEGCFNVILNKKDLMKKDFSKCVFEYNQS